MSEAGERLRCNNCCKPYTLDESEHEDGRTDAFCSAACALEGQKPGWTPWPPKTSAENADDASMAALPIFVKAGIEEKQGLIIVLDYHPWRGGANPEFDHYDSTILSLKRCEPQAIDYFFGILDPNILPGIALATVPSSTRSKSHNGIRLLAKRLAANNRIDATHCLRRRIDVDPAHMGGSRSVESCMRTIEVYDPNFVIEKTILLMDDVTTSGSSLTACSRLLEDAGAAVVRCLALGKTV